MRIVISLLEYLLLVEFSTNISLKNLSLKLFMGMLPMESTDPTEFFSYFDSHGDQHQHEWVLLRAATAYLSSGIPSCRWAILVHTGGRPFPVGPSRSLWLYVSGFLGNRKALLSFGQWLWQDSVKSGTGYSLRPKFIGMTIISSEGEILFLPVGVPLIFNKARSKALGLFNIGCKIFPNEFFLEFYSFILLVQRSEAYRNLRTFV